MSMVTPGEHRLNSGCFRRRRFILSSRRRSLPARWLTGGSTIGESDPTSARVLAGRKPEDVAGELVRGIETCGRCASQGTGQGRREGGGRLE